jgi:hypothetical protein
MKFSSAIVIAAVAGVASAEFNLRAAVNKFTSSSSNEPTNAEVRVSIHGMKGDASAGDMEIIHSSIKKAYNHAYQTTGYSMDLFEAQLSAPVPDKVSWDPYCRLCPPEDTMVASSNTEGQMFLGQVKVSWDPYCRLCPPEVDATIKNLGDVHAAFEKEFCAGLRQSGSKNLAHARDCTLSFLDTTGQNEENMPIQSKEGKGRKTETQLTLQGTLHNFSEKDMEILDEAVIGAYNDAFSSAGYSLGSFVSTADLDIPSKVSWDPYCRLCPPDADMAGDAKLIISTAAPLGWDPYCRLCPPEEGAMVADLSDAKLAFLHTAFENTLCTKLQKSGSANFANVHDCSFRFVYAPVAETTSQY